MGAVIHKALSQAVKLGYIIANPAAACELPRIEKKEIQPLEQAKMTEFLKAIENEQYKNLFAVTLFTGVRQGEILGLPWRNVDFQKGQITISQQLQISRGKRDLIKHDLDGLVNTKILTQAQEEKIVSALSKSLEKSGGFEPALDKLIGAKVISVGQKAAVLKALDTESHKYKNGYYIASTKSGKARTITPAPFVMQTIRNERAKQAENKLRLGPVFENKDDLVFTDETGKHLASLTVYNHFKRIAKKIEIPAARFHDLRHTYATSALYNGDDVKTVQTNLGHATASFTLDVYAHASEKMKQDSADRM
jgi:integrase